MAKAGPRLHHSLRHEWRSYLERGAGFSPQLRLRIRVVVLGEYSVMTKAGPCLHHSLRHEWRSYLE